MELNELIESGLLEAYVLGSVSEEERRLVEDMARTHPAVATEIKSIETLFAKMANANSIAPPAQMQDKIWHAINSDAKSTTSTPTIPLTATTNNGKSSTPIVDINTNRPAIGMYRFAAVAATVLLVVSIGYNYYQSTQMQKMHGDMDTIASTQQQMQKSMALQKADMEATAKQLAMATNPDMKMVHLNGLAKAPDSHVMLFWDTKSSDVYVHVDQLPAVPQGMQYQLWAIVDGKPVDAGMLTDGAIQKMKAMDGKVQAFAITLEKAGGSPVPTMDQMFVMGKV